MGNPRDRNIEMVSADALHIKAGAFLVTIIGPCGKGYRTPISEWKKLKKKIDAAIKARSK